MNRYHLETEPPTADQIFVFGSNLAGRHGKGAADYAYKNKGARYGQGIGIQGSSYAIPTKDHWLKPIPLWRIEEFVKDFLHYTVQAHDKEFYLTRIGCGLAGYKDEQIAPMFEGYYPNIVFPNDWMKWIERRY